MKKYFAAIEAGGTKFNCAIFDENKTILDECRIKTTRPDETIPQVIDFFTHNKTIDVNYESLGIGSFGPIDMDKSSKSYGNITKTPKPFWSNTPLVLPLANALACPVAFDTDVNAAALAEYRWGSAQNNDVVIYVTVGTGIGGGVVINGKPLHGLVHPEIGHIALRGHSKIKGICPFHENCAEGLASGTALNTIWKQNAETLAFDHEAWDIEAEVLSQLCYNLLVSFSPQKIIFGGGVMTNKKLIPEIIKKTEESLNGYLSFPDNISVSNIITSPGLGDKSGLFGALALAQTQALYTSSK